MNSLHYYAMGHIKMCLQGDGHSSEQSLVISAAIHPAPRIKEVRF